MNRNTRLFEIKLIPPFKCGWSKRSFLNGSSKLTFPESKRGLFKVSCWYSGVFWGLIFGFTWCDAFQGPRGFGFKCSEFSGPFLTFGPVHHERASVICSWSGAAQSPFDSAAPPLTLIHSSSLTNRIRAKRRKISCSSSKVPSAHLRGGSSRRRHIRRSTALCPCSFCPAVVEGGAASRSWAEQIESRVELCSILFKKWPGSGGWRCGRSWLCCCQGTCAWKQVCMKFSTF